MLAENIKHLLCFSVYLWIDQNFKKEGKSERAIITKSYTHFLQVIQILLPLADFVKEKMVSPPTGEAHLRTKGISPIEKAIRLTGLHS